MPTDIQPIHYNTIIQSIRKGNCVPFLGAGVNVSSEEYQGLPLAFDVALHIVKELTDLSQEQLENLLKTSSNDVRLRLAQSVANLDEEQVHNLSEDAIDEYLSLAGPLPNLLKATLPDLARVALHVEVEAGFPYLLEKLHEILDEKCEPSPLLKSLAKLNIKLIVTTNYDHLLEKAFNEIGIVPEVVVQHITGFDEQKLDEEKKRLALTEVPIVYKIHGSFSDKRDQNNGSKVQESDRIILTEEDYIQFLSILGREDIGIPSLISNKMIRGTILFLGYSLQDWDFRTIYKALIEPMNQYLRPKSFAIQKNPPDFWVRYWERKGVTILDVDLYQFAAELEKRWNGQSKD